MAPQQEEAEHVWGQRHNATLPQGQLGAIVFATAPWIYCAHMYVFLDLTFFVFVELQ